MEQKNKIEYQLGLTDSEYYERELLLEKERVKEKWFSQEDFDRLKVLSEKMFAKSGLPSSEQPQ